MADPALRHFKCKQSPSKPKRAGWRNCRSAELRGFVRLTPLRAAPLQRRRLAWLRAAPAESTLLYKVVEHHLETFLAEAREKHDKPLPRHVDNELRAYLSCGILSHGLLRARRWLLRSGLLSLEADEASNETPELSALDACTRASVGIGQLTHVESDGGHEDDAADELQGLRPRKGGGRYFGEAMGFGLHAGVSVPAGNAFGRELLLRYCARPPFALERMSLLADGRIAYRLKKPWRPDQTHRVMTPTELLARISAIIPPPRSPLIRFHGVFAPNFPRRGEVVPTGQSLRSTGCVKASGVPRQDSSSKPVQAEAASTIADPDNKKTPSADSTDAARSRSSPGAPTLASVNRVLSSSGYSSAPWRIDWATLLHRVYDADALACRCGGRLEFVELVVRPSWARTIVERLGLQSETPVLLPARTVDLEPVEAPRRDWDP